MTSSANPVRLRTLAIDVGGSDLKLVVLNETGQPDSESIRTPIPSSRRPAEVLAAITHQAEALRPFDRAAVGFPGPIVDDSILTAANLGDAWIGVHLERELQARLGVPVRAANDADVQGFGAIRGHGVELVITLGTGLGSALFVDGTLVPNLELGQHPFREGQSYESLLGLEALRKGGKDLWKNHLLDAIDRLRRTFYFRALFIGGGNARLLDFELPADVEVVSNQAGLVGGHALWRSE